MCVCIYIYCENSYLDGYISYQINHLSISQNVLYECLHIGFIDFDCCNVDHQPITTLLLYLDYCHVIKFMQ